MHKLAALLLCFTLDAHAQVAGSYFSRLNFSEMSEQNQAAYVAGVADAIGSGHNAGVPSQVVSNVSNCFEEKKIGVKQLMLTTRSIIQNSPEKLHETAADAVLEAISKICIL